MTAQEAILVTADVVRSGLLTNDTVQVVEYEPGKVAVRLGTETSDPTFFDRADYAEWKRQRHAASN